MSKNEENKNFFDDLLEKESKGVNDLSSDFPLDLDDNRAVRNPILDSEDVIFYDNKGELTKEHVEAIQSYEPDWLNDDDAAAEFEKIPLPHLDKHIEARAVAYAGEELIRAKKFIRISYAHMLKELERVYGIYPIALKKEITRIHDDSLKEISELVDDLYHLVTASVDKAGLINKDPKFYKEYEEKRTQILHTILAFYEKRN